MSKRVEKKPPPLEEGIVRALRSIDKQIAREMQRSPSQLATHGVQKWEPFEQRVEQVTSLVLASFGEQTVELDGIVVLTRAFAKALALLVDELGPEGLGELRSAYCEDAFRHLERDVANGRRSLDDTPQLN